VTISEQGNLLVTGSIQPSTHCEMAKVV